MVIKLNEIPIEGLLLKFNQTNRKIADSLHDLLGHHPFQVKAHILPIDWGYEISGMITGCRTLECSFCVQEFEQSFCEKFHDIYCRDEKKACFQVSDVFSQTSIFPLKSLYFSLTGLLHEILVLGTDFQILCQKDCRGLCQGCGCNLNYEKCLCKLQIGQTKKKTGKNKKGNANTFSVLSKLL